MINIKQKLKKKLNWLQNQFKNNSVKFAVGVQLLLWFLFPVRFYATIDEHNYLLSAWRLANGESLIVTNPFLSLGGFITEAGFVSKYNLGNSIIHAPISMLPGVLGHFLLSLLITFATYYLVSLIIKKLQLPRLSLAFVILFPIFTYFSRTVFSELAAGLFFTYSFLETLNLIGNNKYSRRKRIFKLLSLGLILGFLSLVRYNFLIWAILVVFVLIYKNYKFILPLIMGAALPAVAFLMINFTLYGGFFNSGYILSGEQQLDINLLFRRLFQYAFYLNLIYPGLFIISGIGIKKAKIPKELKLILTIFILFLIFLYSLSGGFLVDGDLQDAITGLRFFVPVMFVLLPFYFIGLQEIFKKRLFEVSKNLILLIFLGIAGLNILVSYQHYQFIEGIRDNYERISPIIKKPESTLFIGNPGDEIYFGPHLNESFSNDGFVRKENFDEKQLEDFDSAYMIDDSDMLKSINE
jgi:hypothetical protein